MNDRYQNDRKFRKQQIKKSVRNEALRRVEIGKILEDFKKNGCALCPEKEPCCMSAHHLNPEEKDFSIANSRKDGYSLKKVVDELKKCICVCENCHRKIHAGKLKAVVSQLVEESDSESEC